MTTDQRPAATPLIERLASVPRDARLSYEHSPTCHSMFPIGLMCEEAAARLEAAEAGWLPIESAPKDRTRVLLSYRWSHRERYMAEGWWGMAGWTTHGQRGVRATHWQPLPSPPSAEKGQP